MIVNNYKIGRAGRSAAALLITLLCTVGGARGAEAPVVEAGNSDTFADRAHDAVSDSVNAAAEWFDRFFDDPRIEQEAAYSRVKLSGGVLFEEGERARFKPRASASLELPRTKRKLRLIVSRDEQGRLLDQQAERDAARVNDTDAAAGLQYSLKSGRRTDFSWRIGVRLGGDHELLTGPRYRRTLNLDSWLARFTESLLWGTDTGWQSRTRLDFDHLVDERYFFRWTTELLWRESDPGLRLDSNFLLGRSLGERGALVYELDNRITTSPRRHLDESTLAVGYRRRVWRRWLFVETSPRLIFRNDDRFRPTPALFLELEMIFGGRRARP